jgi:hypothetical protein
MLKSIIATVGLSLIGVTAMADGMFIQQAQEEGYCPAPGSLVFKANQSNRKTGTVTGPGQFAGKGKNFMSADLVDPLRDEHNVPRPAHLNNNNQITDADYAANNQVAYGYKDGNTIVCIYSYGIDGGSYSLTMWDNQ